MEMAPAFAQFEQTNQSKATIVDINVDDKDVMKRLASYAESGAIPETVFLKDGKVVWRGHPARIKPENIDKLLAG